MDKILVKKKNNVLPFRDKKDHQLNFAMTWNNFISVSMEKIHLSLDQFLEKMNDPEYIRVSINKIEFQERLTCWNFIREEGGEKKLSNIFSMKLPLEDRLCCDSQYYFIYKNSFNFVDEKDDNFFLPTRKSYLNRKIDVEGVDYLANFAVPINHQDYIYCLKCKTLLKKNDLFNENLVISID